MKEYGLQHNGELIRVETTSNEDGDFCGENTYRLTDDKSCPIWKVENLKDLQMAMSFDTQWYNSEYNKPCWGDFEKEDLKPVEIIMEIKPIEVEPIPVIENLIGSVRDIPYILVKSYSNKVLEKNTYVLAIVGSKKEEMEKHIGKKIGFDIYNQRMLYDVIPVPEDCLEASRVKDFENSCALIMGLMTYN